MRITRGLGLMAMGAMVACTEADVSGPGPQARRALTPAPAGSLAWGGEYQGETGPGSQYSLYVPTNWNGKLVVYVHGFVDAALPVALPSVDALRDAIGTAGYAVAYSSFSENGFAFSDGLQRTHQLRGLFVSRFGQPTQTLVIGHSLGGLITLALAERYPTQYDGALPMCGVVGGTRRELQYIGDVRAIFDYFYPNVLPGDATELPPITNLNAQILGPAQAAIAANPTGAFVLAGIAQTPIPGINPTEVVTSVLTALGFHARGLSDLTDRAQGKAPYGNADELYASTAYAALMGPLNTSVERFSLAANANAWLRHNYEPSGDLAIPVLTLHTTRDPVVPFFHEGLLAAQVAQRGAGANLLQRSISRYGHCTFAIPEMLTSLNDLATWVDTGVKPAA
jgi:pimeloyl-ACP methyl ester carboxylesterase